MSNTHVVHNLRKFFQGGEAHNGRGGGCGFAVPHGGKHVSPSSSGLRSLVLSLTAPLNKLALVCDFRRPPTLQCTHSVHRAAHATL